MPDTRLRTGIDAFVAQDQFAVVLTEYVNISRRIDGDVLPEIVAETTARLMVRAHAPENVPRRLAFADEGIDGRGVNAPGRSDKAPG